MDINVLKTSECHEPNVLLVEISYQRLICANPCSLRYSVASVALHCVVRKLAVLWCAHAKVQLFLLDVLFNKKDCLYLHHVDGERCGLSLYTLFRLKW